VAHCRDGGRPSWRPVIEGLRANRPPMVEAVISSITRRRGDWVRWRPVFEQVLPWRSLNSAAEIDPKPTPTVHRSTLDNVDWAGREANVRRDHVGDRYSIRSAGFSPLRMRPA
jgi:hypothetical protein